MNPKLLKRISVTAIRNDFNFKRIIATNNFVHLYSFSLMAIITAISVMFFQAATTSLIVFLICCYWLKLTDKEICAPCASLEDLDMENREAVEQIAMFSDRHSNLSDYPPPPSIEDWFNEQTTLKEKK